MLLSKLGSSGEKAPQNLINENDFIFLLRVKR